jgi:hypothetical protein
MMMKKEKKEKNYQRNSQHGLPPEVVSACMENVLMMPKHDEKIPYPQSSVGQCCENLDIGCQGTAHEGSQQLANHSAKNGMTYYPGFQTWPYIP